MHDLLFESGFLNPNSVNAKRADLAACYRHVEQYEAKIARDEQEENNRQAAAEQRNEQAAQRQSESHTPSVRRTTPGAASSYGGTPSLGDLFAAQSQALSDMREHWIERQMQIDQENSEKQAQQRRRLQQEESLALGMAAADQAEEKRADRQDVINDFQSAAETLASNLDSKQGMTSERDSIEHSTESNRVSSAADFALQAEQTLRGNGLEHLLGLVNDDDLESRGPLAWIVKEVQEGATGLYQKATKVLEHPETPLVDGTILGKAIDMGEKHIANPYAMLTEKSDSLKPGVTYEIRDLLRTSVKDDESAQTIGGWLREKIVSKASARATEYLRSAPAERACGNSESGSLNHSFCVLNVAANPFNMSKGVKPYLEDVQLKFADFFQIATGQASDSSDPQ